MRKCLQRILLWLTILCLLPASSCAEPGGDAGPVCRLGDTDCLVLQLVSSGNFAVFDPSDMLSTRVFSAALPRLTALDEADFAHFAGEFPEEEACMPLCWYIALGNCLWADILAEPDAGDERTQAARRVMLLFLEPADTSSAREQQATIRSRLTDEIIAEIAQAAGVTAAFVEHVVYSDDWRRADGLE